MSWFVATEPTQNPPVVRRSPKVRPVGFDEVFASDGIRTIRTPIRAPVAMPSLSASLGTLRECLDKIVIFGRLGAKNLIHVAHLGAFMDSFTHNNVGNPEQ